MEVLKCTPDTSSTGAACSDTSSAGQETRIGQVNFGTPEELAQEPTSDTNQEGGETGRSQLSASRWPLIWMLQDLLEQIFQLIQRLATCLTYTLLITIWLSALLVLCPLTMIAVGTIFYHQCRQAPVPPAIISVGLTSIINIIVHIFQHRINRIWITIVNCLLAVCLEVSFFIVVDAFQPDFYDSSSRHYCHPFVYMYSFWVVLTILICWPGYHIVKRVLVPLIHQTN